jgi:hypothetical protein
MERRRGVVEAGQGFVTSSGPLADGEEMAEERRAMVVGASRRLGLDLAVELRTRNWAVVATARDTAEAARLAALAARPGSSLVVETVNIAMRRWSTHRGAALGRGKRAKYP